MDHIYLLVLAFLVFITSLHSKEYIRVCHLKHWPNYKEGDIDAELCTHIVFDLYLIERTKVGGGGTDATDNDRTVRTDGTDGTDGTDRTDGIDSAPTGKVSDLTTPESESGKSNKTDVDVENGGMESDGANVSMPESGEIQAVNNKDTTVKDDASTAEDGALTAEDGSSTAEDGASTVKDGASTLKDDASTAEDMGTTTKVGKGEETSHGGSTNDSSPPYIIDMSEGDFQMFASLKKQKPSLKILLSIRDGLDDRMLAIVLRSNFTRFTFSAMTANHMKANNLDGIKIDFQYFMKDIPTDEKWESIVDLIKNLKEVYSLLNLSIVAAVPMVSFPVKYAKDIVKMTEDMEFLTIKAYGYHDDSNKRGHNAALMSSRHNSTVDWTMNYWVNMGVDPSKLVLGIEFKARCYTLDKITFNVNYGIDKDVVDNKCPPVANNEPISYRKICNIIGNPKAKRVWNVEEEVPYLVFNKLWVGFENPRSLMKKVEYLKKRNYGGWHFFNTVLDDFGGEACGSQKYPLLVALNKAVMDDFNINDTAKLFPEIPVGKFSDDWPLSSDGTGDKPDENPSGKPDGGSGDESGGGPGGDSGEKPGGGTGDESGDKPGGGPGGESGDNPGGDSSDKPGDESGGGTSVDDVTPGGESDVTTEGTQGPNDSGNPSSQTGDGETKNPELATEPAENEKPKVWEIGRSSKMGSNHLMLLSFVLLCFTF